MNRPKYKELYYDAIERLENQKEENKFLQRELKSISSIAAREGKGFVEILVELSQTEHEAFSLSPLGELCLRKYLESLSRVTWPCFFIEGFQALHVHGIPVLVEKEKFIKDDFKPMSKN